MGRACLLARVRSASFTSCRVDICSVGEALDCPARTFNLTLLRHQEMIWDLSSLEDDDAQSMKLAEYLQENDSKRCIVVLDVSSSNGPCPYLNSSNRKSKRPQTHRHCGHCWYLGNSVRPL
jgi:hypothetical protein